MPIPAGPAALQTGLTSDVPGVLLDLGARWLISVTTWRDGYPVGDVAPTLLVTLPTGATASPVFTEGVTYGTWVAYYTTTVAGRHIAHVSTVEDALDLAAYVAGPATAAGMPNVNDVVRFLRSSAASWTAGELQEELDAETDAQQARCGVRATYPRDLRKALLRRVQRALAMRALPLAVAQGDADGGSFLLPGADPEVRRLEGPYRKLGCG